MCNYQAMTRRRPPPGPSPADEHLRRVFEEAAREYIATGVNPEFVHRGNSVNWRRPVTIVRTLLELIDKGGTFIDIGAGEGMVPRMMAKSGKDLRVIVIDSEQSSGTGDVDALAGTGIETILATVGQDEIPLESGTADVVFAGDVVEHLPHTPRHFMNACKRLLRPGGWLVLDTPNATCLRTRLKVAAGISNWTTLEGIYEPELNIHHHKEYTGDEMRSLFERAGFEQVDVEYFEHFWYKSLKKRGALQTMGLEKGEASRFGTGFNPKLPYEYGRMVFLGLAKMAPSLRSSIIARGRKPA